MTTLQIHKVEQYHLGKIFNPVNSFEVSGTSAKMEQLGRELCRMADDYLCEIRMRGDSNVSFRMEDAMRSKREEIWAEDRRCRGW